MTVSLLEAVQHALRGRIDDEEAAGKLTPDAVRSFAGMVRGLTVDGSVVRCPAGRVGAELADFGRAAIAGGELPVTLRFEVAGVKAARQDPAKRKRQPRRRSGMAARERRPVTRMEPRDKGAEREALAVRIAAQNGRRDVARTPRIHGRELLDALHEAGGPDWSGIPRPVGWIVDQQRAMRDPNLERTATADEDRALIDFAR